MRADDVKKVAGGNEEQSLDGAEGDEGTCDLLDGKVERETHGGKEGCGADIDGCGVEGVDEGGGIDGEPAGGRLGGVVWGEGTGGWCLGRGGCVAWSCGGGWWRGTHCGGGVMVVEAVRERVRGAMRMGEAMVGRGGEVEHRKKG